MATNTVIGRPDEQDSGGYEILKFLARTGYLAKGIIYVTVGILAASAVFGWFGVSDAAGTRGAVEAIASQPFGNFLLILLVAGLAGYVAWRFAQGLLDTEDIGTGAEGWALRIGFMISGSTYAMLAYYAVRLSGWLPAGASGGRVQSPEMKASLMQSDAGMWLAGLVGACFLFVGLYQAYRAISCKFNDNWKTHRLSNSEKRIVTRLAQVGIGVRAVTFLIIGSLVAEAAMNTNPSQAKGLGEALRTIAEQPFGQVLLAIAAFGLVCYGVYCFVDSRYRAMTID